MAKKKTTDKNGEDGGKKRSALSLGPLLLLLLLLLIILLLLFFAGGGWFGGGGKGGWFGGKDGWFGGRGKSGLYNDSLRLARLNDSLRAARLNDSLRLARLNDSINSARLNDSINLARLDDSLRLARLNDSINLARLNDSLRLADPRGGRDKSRLYNDSLRLARRLNDSLRLARLNDSLRLARLNDSLRLARLNDSLRLARLNDSLRLARLNDSINLAREDSLRLALAADSLANDSLRVADSIAKAAIEAAALRAAACARDTLRPLVYADPSGGLHRGAVSVKLVANKVCKVEWSIDGVSDWKVYDGGAINISKPSTLYYRASDDCGRVMNIKSRRYEFDASASRCPAGAEPVKAGGADVCVDVYEWPNKKGAAPLAYVSLYQAMDSCFSVRKRLCTSEEWTAACGGPEGWKYTYGEVYEWDACAVRDSSARRSGSKPECRGYYGVFDMSGNLAEWTSTPAPRDKSFNNVMGGFWASGDQSRCADARYSYFPQNRHNPVGFRCCVDAPPAAGGGR